MNRVINTIFGRAIINTQGYYQITSSKEGNHGKKLHRLIWEKSWGKIPKGHHIHHIDGNPLNNCILNLIAIPGKMHHQLHMKGENHPNYGKHHSEETRRKIGEAQKGEKHHMWGKKGKDNPNYGKKMSAESRRKISEARTGMKMSEEANISNSKARNATGYYRVYKHTRKEMKQGFTYVYSYYDENNHRKIISSVYINKLEDKVKAKGLKWLKFNEEGD